MRALPPLLAALLAGLIVHGGRGADAPPLKLLFLGDNAGHQPAARFEQLRPVFAARNITLTYTDKLDDLNAAKLNQFDGLMVYANHTKIAPEQEKALLAYVASGKGFIPVHCASYCFLNSPAYIDLVGAQFRSHTTGTFRTTAVAPDHPILKGYRSFTSWDETYTHHKHNEKDRTLLEVREEAGVKEPWTWTRTHGKGRVFYTAWGHDQRTWGNPGFHNLLERGTRWACNQDPALAGTFFDRPDMTTQPKGLAPFEYVPAKVPFYPAGKKAGAKGDPGGRMQKPLSPAESVRHYVTPVGFAVRAFVTEEKLGGKPLAMAWDEKGRLWVSVTLDYPNELKPAGQGRDRIVVCTDTDGDGVCDTVTTFADKLSIVTSLLPYAGGVIAHQAPVTLFLRDNDGDGKADVRQELIRGWSTGDTHAGPSNLRYGFDNWVYGAIGYAGFNGVVNGERLNFRQGFYRFKVETGRPQEWAGAELKVTKLEFLRSTNNNTWGLNFDEAGELFGSTANGCPLVHMPIPNRYTEQVRGLSATPLANIAADNHFEPVTDHVRQVDWHGGFTAASHVALYTARTYPREYWGRTAFLCEPTGHLTATFTLKPNGATFAATYGWNLLASDDEWAAPIDAQVGPDGNVWVNDWYNFIVQHNPTPAGFKNGAGNAYETELRDKTHGRIYRVVHDGKADAGPKLVGASPEELVAALKSPNLGWRLHAQRLLVERGKKDIEPELLKLVKDTSVDETGLNAGAVHGIWTYSGLLGPKVTPTETADFLAAGLAHPSPAVRRATYMGILSKWSEPGDKLLLKTLGPTRSPFKDADPAVRVAALLALADQKDAPNLMPTLRASLSDPSYFEPPGITEAVAAAGAAHPLRFLSMSEGSGFLPPVPAARLKVIELVARTFAADPKLPPAPPGDFDKPPVDELFDHLGGHPQRDEAVLTGLLAGWPAGRRLDLRADTERTIGFMLKEPERMTPAGRAKLLRLASVWGVKGIDQQIAGVVTGLLTTAADAKAADAARIDAAKSVMDLRPDDADAAAKLLAAVTPQTSPALAAGIFEALANSRSKAIGPAVVGRLRELPGTVRPAAIRLVLGRPDSAAAFLDAVEKGQLRFDMLALDQKTALACNADKAVAARAQKLLAAGGGLPSPDRQKVIDELHHVVNKTGDVAKGKTVFTAQCAKCHTYAGEGTQVGPDLTGMAVHPKEELLIHILDPSRSVEGNYKAYRVVTGDGRSLTGLLAGETKTSVEVVDAEGKRHPLSRDDIESLTETEKSLMPEGFEKQINPTELTDLLEFLTQKGKYVPVPLDRVATVVTTKGMFFEDSGVAERLAFADWKPKTFNGVPFILVDPQGDKTKNAVMLYGPNGKRAPDMPKSVTLPYAGKAKAVHLLSGIGGWNFPALPKGTVSMTIRLRYEDGKTEDHDLVNGVHFADYIRRVDVPGSQFAFGMRGGQQVRYLAVTPRRPDVVIRIIEFVKGPDGSAPVVMAVTVESP